MRATDQNGTYPRPQLCRAQWTDLDGEWRFVHDDGDEGLSGRWFEPGHDAAFTRTITVPFPPESPASGVGETGFHPVVWYRRTVAHEVLVAGPAQRSLVHFGAVDFRATVWLDGHLVARHVGGQTPFTADVTETLTDASEHVLVVRAEDDPLDAEQPRGKQDWLEHPHAIWYERTTGIWQSVWAEVVPADHIAALTWTPDVVGAAVHGEITLPRRPRRPLTLEISVALGDEVLTQQSVAVLGATTTLDLSVPAVRNGQDRERLLWSPERPTLLDVAVVLRNGTTGEVVDTVASYVGLRSAGVGDGAFLLNGHPYFVRSVLDQGYRPQTHLANAGTDELRAEVQLIKDMGFNAVRLHQKADDPRKLFWADRLGLLVWGETAGAYAFSSRAVELLFGEWTELVRRDRSHPSIVTWVPINESWGVQDIAQSPAQRSFVRALADLTRALDPSRPVVTNEGWEHVDSDIVGVHDYTSDGALLASRYGAPTGPSRMREEQYGPAGRLLTLTEWQRESFADGSAPLMVTEFGGISMSTEREAWGYASVTSPDDYEKLLSQLFEPLHAGADLAGFCYTQLLDTGQETNGLALADRTPKLPLHVLRRIVTGSPD